MFRPKKVIDLEVGQPLPKLGDIADYETLYLLIRCFGRPVTILELPVRAGNCDIEEAYHELIDNHAWKLLCCLLERRLEYGAITSAGFSELLPEQPRVFSAKDLPLVTVAVCTRDRPEDLKNCLAAISKLDYPNLEVLVIDNAPSDTTTESLIRDSYPQIRYICEPRPGLDWARNRAILEADGEIIAYTDDDVIVDSGWVSAVARVFAANPEVMALTGLVVPFELETEAQVLFEQYGGFNRGYERKWINVDSHKDRSIFGVWGTGQYGTGANMAFRRNLFDRIGGFDPALDVGTVTNGGGDLEMFFRVLREGYTLVYEPDAIVRHRHRRDYGKLRQQIQNNSLALFAYFTRSMGAYPSERLAFMQLIWWYIWRWNIVRLIRSFIKSDGFPRDLILAEFGGLFRGIRRYRQARHSTRTIMSQYPYLPSLNDRYDKPAADYRNDTHDSNAVAVRHIEINEPIPDFTDTTCYKYVKVYVSCSGRLLGYMQITNNYLPLRAMHLRQELVSTFGIALLCAEEGICQSVTSWEDLIKELRSWLLPAEQASLQLTKEFVALTNDAIVSIVVATYDRPDDLNECLHCLMRQQSTYPLEIIVVDNHPASGLTPPIVTRYPRVKLVEEPRQGLAYARNAGIVASTGAIIVATDDDVLAPPDWLDKLIQPFAQPDVMVVTGNVLPVSQDTHSQRLFELYGGLGRGFKGFKVDRQWFDSFRNHAVPTWSLGATANAAFRSDIFRHPDIGLMDEALGPGLPSGVGEDAYLFYKVLQAGYSVVYESSAFVWHKHRRTMQALRRQIYNYSKGHVAYHLTTLLRDGDKRALKHMLVHLPQWHCKQFIKSIKLRYRGSPDRYSLKLILLEIYGNCAGPWALWRSHRIVRRLGRSNRYPSIDNDSRQNKPAATDRKQTDNAGRSVPVV